MPIYAFANPLYQPAMRAILSITNAFPATITTTLNGTTPGNHLYISGTIVRLDIPLGFGMQSVNQMFGPITVTSDTTFTITINTIGLDPFAIPAGTTQQAQSVPIGENNDILTAAVINSLDSSVP